MRREKTTNSKPKKEIQNESERNQDRQQQFIPKGKKTSAKKAVQSVAATYAARGCTKVLAKRASQVGVKALAGTAAKTATKVALNTTAKVATKSFARGIANPWLLAADGVDFGARKVCERMDMDEDTARVAGKGAGLAASVGIGVACGGPLGAVAGAVLWGIGEGVSKLCGWDD